MESDEVRKRVKRTSNRFDDPSSPTTHATTSSSSDSDDDSPDTSVECQVQKWNKRRKSAGERGSSRTDHNESGKYMDVMDDTTNLNEGPTGHSGLEVDQVKHMLVTDVQSSTIAEMSLDMTSSSGNVVHTNTNEEPEKMGYMSRLPTEILLKILNLLCIEELMCLRLTNAHSNSAVLAVAHNLERMRHVQIAGFTEKASTVVEEDPSITVSLKIQAQDNQNYMVEREPPLQFTMSLRTAEKWLRNKTVKTVKLGSTLSNAIETFVSRTRMRAKTVMPRETYGTELSDFNMLNTLAVKLRSNHIHLRANHSGVHVSQLKGVKELTFEHPPPSFSYLPLESQIITLANVLGNCQRLNELIKAWVAGERDIERVYEHVAEEYDMDKVEANDLNGVQYNKVVLEESYGRQRCFYLISRPNGQLILRFQSRQLYLYNGSIWPYNNIIKTHFKTYIAW